MKLNNTFFAAFEFSNHLMAKVVLISKSHAVVSFFFFSILSFSVDTLAFYTHYQKNLKEEMIMND